MCAHEEEKRERMKNPQVYSELSVDHDTGLDLTTLRSWPEPSESGWATRALPPNLLVFYIIFSFIWFFKLFLNRDFCFFKLKMHLQYQEQCVVKLIFVEWVSVYAFVRLSTQLTNAYISGVFSGHWTDLLAHLLALSIANVCHMSLSFRL